MMRACPGLSPTLPTAAPLVARPHQSIPHEVFLPSVSPHNMTSGTCMHSLTMGQDMAVSWSLTSLFSKNMAISETTGHGTSAVQFAGQL